MRWRSSTRQLKVGVIGSLGVRRDAASVPALAALLGDCRPGRRRGGGHALGNIGTRRGRQGLGPTAPSNAPEGAEAGRHRRLSGCAPSGCWPTARRPRRWLIYKSLTGEEQPKHVRLAATRGMLTVAGKKSDRA